MNNRLTLSGAALLCAVLAQPALAAEPASCQPVRFAEIGWADIAALATRARVVIGNDTGPTHLAAAMGAPTLLLVSDVSASALAEPFETIRPLHQPNLTQLGVRPVIEALSQLLAEEVAS